MNPQKKQAPHSGGDPGREVLKLFIENNARYWADDFVPEAPDLDDRDRKGISALLYSRLGIRDFVALVAWGDATLLEASGTYYFLTLGQVLELGKSPRDALQFFTGNTDWSKAKEH